MAKNKNKNKQQLNTIAPAADAVAPTPPAPPSDVVVEAAQAQPELTGGVDGEAQVASTGSDQQPSEDVTAPFGGTARVGGVLVNVCGEDRFVSDIAVNTGSPDTIVVKQGDTVDGLATLYGVPVDTLKKLNPKIDDRKKVFIGQELRLK